MTTYLVVDINNDIFITLMKNYLYYLYSIMK